MELACSASLLRVNRERAHSPPGALSPVFCIGYACEFVLCRNSFAIRKVPETKPVRAVTTTAAVVLLITPKATAETLRFPMRVVITATSGLVCAGGAGTGVGVAMCSFFLWGGD